MATIMPVWQPIEDIAPSLLSRPRHAGLASLEPVWAETRQSLSTSQALSEFNERLAREWSIETGIIERLYTLDRGVTQLMVEKGFDEALLGHGDSDLPPSQLVAMLRAHREALDGLFAFIKGERPLPTSYIKELHVVLTQAQHDVLGVDSLGRTVRVPLVRGEWKTQPNNPTREDGTVIAYCPPEQVPGQMEALVRLHHEHEGVPPEVEAAWLHHRFTQIHPFQDGNGRVARALATLCFLRADLLPLVIDRDQRADYIRRLEAADLGDLLQMIDLFAENAQRALVRALGVAEDALRATPASGPPPARWPSACVKATLSPKRQCRRRLGPPSSWRTTSSIACPAFAPN